MSIVKPVPIPLASVALLLSCGAPTGAEGGHCYGNHTCNDGLTCLSNLCVVLPDATSSRTDGAPPDAVQPVDAQPLDAIALDGPSLVCNDDSSIEPNDSTSNAFVTPIPDFNTCTSMVSLAICPDTDKDLFLFRVNTTGKNLRSTVATDVTSGQLTLRVLNGSGNPIGTGLPIDSGHIELVINNLAAGTYYVEVAAPIGVQNNYDLDILTCDVTGCAGVTCQ